MYVTVLSIARIAFFRVLVTVYGLTLIMNLILFEAIFQNFRYFPLRFILLSLHKSFLNFLLIARTVFLTTALIHTTIRLQ
jgi:hypothetical protein